MGIRRAFSFYTGIALAALVLVNLPSPTYAQVGVTCRDPVQQPFAADSPWNRPIGASAQFVPANFKLPTGGFTLEENVIIMENKGAPMKPVQMSASSGWDGTPRCQASGSNMYDGKQFPIPGNFTTNDLHEGGTPNAAGAILDADGKTIYQNQPLMVCGKGGNVTSRYQYPTVDIKGDGIQGAQGGSGLSSVGGAIRISEMKAGYRIPHALKLTIYGVENISGSGNGYRWPAVKADSGWDRCGSDSNAYCGSVPALKMGALLALPSTVDINSLGLSSETSKMIARALQEYGGYVVDNSAWSNVHFAVEFGPAGDGVNTFNSIGGINNGDINKIFAKLAVVDNNAAGPTAGGGAPTAPTALPFCDGSDPQPTTPPVQPTTPPGGACTTKTEGDADCKNGVSLADFAIWKEEYTGTLGADADGDGNPMDADFDKNSKVQLADFQKWRNTYVGSGGGGGGGGGGGSTVAKPIKIVGIGDSITGQTASWTYALQDRMNAASCTKGTDYDFIGYEQEFPNPDSEPYASRGPAGYDHQRISRGGFNARGMLNVIKAQGFGGVPDVVITYLSVNNYGTGYVDGTYNPPGDGTDATLKKDLKEMIEYARSKNPKVTVILSALQTGQGTDAIKSLATEMNTTTSRVFATDKPDFSGGDVHSIPPDNIASKIYPSLKSVLDANNICN